MMIRGALFMALVVSATLFAGWMVKALDEKEGVGMPPPVAAPKAIVTDEVVARRLVIVNEKGMAVATLTSAANGGGLWLNHPTGPMIAIFTVDGQAGIGFYESSRPKGAMPLAFTLDKEGKPFLQVRDVKGDGQPKWIDLLNLAK